ncbi:putative non-specific serine/threonine protein kinase [Helianthus anomalus]
MTYSGHHKIEMDWRVRYEIALGAARGLEYLHRACERPSNILLVEDMKPKIADFGLEKIVPNLKQLLNEEASGLVEPFTLMK